MLQELEQGEFHRVLPLFGGYLRDPMMYAVIEGRSQGRVFVDDAAVPGAALICTGSESTYVAAGEGSGRFKQALRQILLEEIIPDAKAAGLDFLSLFSFPESYAAELEDLFSDQVPLRTPLSTFAFNENVFYRRRGSRRLQEDGAPELRRLGREELVKPENAYLAGEITTHWGAIDRFLQEGIGFCVLDSRNLVSWCYVQAYGHGAQTIDIWTAPSYRRQGLATGVAAAVIDACLGDGYTPFWICDQANVASRRLAERLGFAYTGDIPLVDIPFEPFSFYQGLAEHFFMPQGEHRQAAESYERALRVKQGEAHDYYRAAVAWAYTEDVDRALDYLEKAIDRGWTDTEAAAREPAFAALRSARWQSLWV